MSEPRISPPCDGSGSSCAVRAAPCSSSLLVDTRGAMMVLGLAMAVLLAAALYYVVGIGEAIDQRETMQDAADAGAFSAAVLHAHGMNLIALINVIMAALLAILVALKLLEAVMTVAIVLLAAAAFFTGGATATAIPTVDQIRRNARSFHEELRGPIHGTLEALHSTARGVRAVVPWTAQLRVLGVIRRHGPYAQGGFALPASTALATTDGAFSTLCEEAGSYVGDVAELAIPPLPGGVDDDVSEALAELARARADWFCGAKGAAPPKTTVTERRSLPTLPARARCEAYPTTSAQYDPHEHAALCEAAVRDEALSAPDRVTGECHSEICEERATLAREACKPSAREPLFNWSYQRRLVERKWGYRARQQGGEWRFVTEEALGDPVLVMPDPEEKDWTPPCGTERAVVAPTWNEEVFDAAKPDEVRPVCVEAPDFPPVRPGAGTAWHKQDIVEVMQVFACVRIAKREIDVGDVAGNDRVDGGDDTAKAPQIIADPDLGGARYQIRAAALGSLPRVAPERVVEAASWGREQPDAFTDALTTLGRISFAQAEYFYAVDDPRSPDPSRWLWNMRWSARLRRFRLPEEDTRTDLEAADVQRWGVDSPPGSLGEACTHHVTDATHDADEDESAEADRCGSMLDTLESIESLVLH